MNREITRQQCARLGRKYREMHPEIYGIGPAGVSIEAEYDADEMRERDADSAEQEEFDDVDGPAAKEMKMTTAIRLEQDLGRSEAIGQFVAECETVIGQVDPSLIYARSALDGFVRAAWPVEGDPADVACEFAHELKAQRG